MFELGVRIINQLVQYGIYFERGQSPVGRTYHALDTKSQQRFNNTITDIIAV